MNINELYTQLDERLQDSIEGIIWAKSLYDSRHKKPVGKKQHTLKALQRKQAIIHAIYRFGYITSTSAFLLLQHTSRNTTSTFLTNLMKEGLIRRYEVNTPEKYIYLIRKPHGVEFLKRTLDAVGIKEEVSYEIDASKIGSGESIYHHELITKEAITHARYGERFLVESEIKSAARNISSVDAFNPKLTDLIVTKQLEDEQIWIAHEFEVSQKSDPRMHYMLKKSDFLIKTNIVNAVIWKTNKDKTFNFIKKAIDVGYVQDFKPGKFDKLIPSGDIYELKGVHKIEVIDEQKTIGYNSKPNELIESMDYETAL